MPWQIWLVLFWIVGIILICLFLKGTNEKINDSIYGARSKFVKKKVYRDLKPGRLYLGKGLKEE